MILSTEEKRILNKKYMDTFLKGDFYDFANFIKRSENGISKDMNFWFNYAKRHLTEEEKKLFFTKVCPFEPGEDKCDLKEKEELKERVVKLATRVNENSANLIDIVDEVGPSLNKYLYMIKQLKYTYKKLGATIVRKNQLYFSDITDYRKSNKLTVKYPHISATQDEVLREIITSRGLPVNDITYKAAYTYAVKNNVIQLDQVAITKELEKYNVKR